MDFLIIFGFLATAIGLIKAMPQLISLIRAKKVRGVSLDTALTTAVVSFGWAAYGFVSDQYSVGIASGLSGVVFVLVAIFALKYGRSIKELKMSPIALLIIAGVGLIWGEVGLGIILPISVFVCNYPQIMVAFKEHDLSGLSLGTWLLSVTEGIIWGSYAMIQQDYPIIAFGLLQLISGSIIVTLKLKKSKNQYLPELTPLA